MLKIYKGISKIVYLAAVFEKKNYYLLTFWKLIFGFKNQFTIFIHFIKNYSKHIEKKKMKICISKNHLIIKDLKLIIQ